MKRPAALILVGGPSPPCWGVFGVSLALIVEHAENSKAVAGPGRERAAVLAATFPSPTPSASRRPVARIRGMAPMPPAANAPSQPAVPASVMPRTTRTRESRRGKLGRGKDNSARGKNTSRFRCPGSHRLGHRLVEN